MNALILFSLVTLGFVMVGRINVLGPIVTIPYLLTYATIEYAYFSLAMTFDIQIRRESKFMETTGDPTTPTFESIAAKKTKKANYGATKTNDLDRLFPERLSHTKHIQFMRLMSSQISIQNSS